uniref:MORN repeat containing 3 n=1 Tax=Rousettus aegyptiacus TaxID=9407 RepID=A0A7J8H3H4_ROUAE|nr:MORN repeat containing 3 [Rousettus aegyptiacus]
MSPTLCQHPLVLQKQPTCLCPSAHRSQSPCGRNGTRRPRRTDHGQLFEGFWVDNVAKCGTMIDFGRDEAPEPTQFPIPEVKVLDPDGLLEEALAMFRKIQEEGD